MARHYLIEDRLTPVHRIELVHLATQPSTTVDAVHAWLRERGYFIGRTAAHNWLRNLRQLGAHPIDQIIRLLRSYSVHLDAEAVQRIHQNISAEIARVAGK